MRQQPRSSRPVLRSAPAAAASSALMALLLGMSAPAAGAPTYTVEARSEAGTPLTTAPIDAKSATGSTPQYVATSALTSEHKPNAHTGTGTSYGWAGTTPGDVGTGVFASAIIVGSGITGATASASSMAHLSDSFIIDCNGCAAGSVGTLRFQVVLITQLNAGAAGAGIIGTTTFGPVAGRATWNSSLQVHSTGIADTPGAPPTTVLAESSRTRSIDTQGLDETTRTGLGSARHTFSLSFAFGKPIELDMLASMTAQGSAAPSGLESQFYYVGQGGAEAYAAWGGITSVFDATGQQVTAFTALTAEGVNYAQSFSTVVPEPGTWALMGLGALLLPVLVGRARRRETT